MNVYEASTLALFNLRANILRTFLTLLGVIIGVAAVVAILTLGSSLSSSIKESFEQIGGRDITIIVEPENQEDTDGDPFASVFGNSVDHSSPYSRFTEDDVERIQQQMGDLIQGVGIGADSNIESYYGTITANNDEPIGATLRFANQSGFEFGSQRIVAGRGIRDEDAALQRKVAVVPMSLVERFFGGDPAGALGQEISFEWDTTYVDVRIIGVFETDETLKMPSEGPPDVQLIVPYTLENVTINPGEDLGWNSLSVRAAADVDPDTVTAELNTTLAQMWANKEGYTARVLDLSSIIEESKKVTAMLSLALAAIAGISLLVGGIGVMNVMLITVTERTREIGIRKALGATGKDIRNQFVIEAMIVCLAGGVVGAVIGSVFGVVGSQLMGYLVPPPVGGLLGSLLFCMFIGLFFGWYPAHRAAKLEPIEALRYE